MLYLSGYVTTNDTEQPDDPEMLRCLRIPNKETSSLYRTEIIGRFASSSALRWGLAFSGKSVGAVSVRVK